MVRQTLAGKLLHDVKNRGVSAWVLCAALIGFYVVLYFGYDVYEPANAFERMQSWLYAHFTHHLDALGGTLFAPVAAMVTSGVAKAIAFGVVIVATLTIVSSSVIATGSSLAHLSHQTALKRR